MSKPNRPRRSSSMGDHHYLSILQQQQLLEQIKQNCKLNGCPLDERNQCLPGHCALTGESESSDIAHGLLKKTGLSSDSND